jgi:hypothetical protein
LPTKFVRATRQQLSMSRPPSDQPSTCWPIFPSLGATALNSTLEPLARPPLSLHHPYTAYYRIEGDEIWIVHIRDDRRKPPDRRDL